MSTKWTEIVDSGAGGAMVGSVGGVGVDISKHLDFIYGKVDKLERKIKEKERVNKAALEAVISESKEELENTRSSIEAQIKDVAEKTSSGIRKDIFSVMALFFTIFAFVSFSIQIFSRVDDVFSAVMILSVIMLSTFSVVSFFLSVLYADEWIKRVFKITALSVVVLLFIYLAFGVVFDKKLHPVGASFQFTESLRDNLHEILLDETWSPDFQRGVEAIVDNRMNVKDK